MNNSTMLPTFNPGFKVTGTKTFRLSSTKLLGTKDSPGYGGNAQNVPDESRRVFVPRPGCKFVQVDLEGAEAVAVALLVREGNFRDLVRNKIKPHNFVAIHAFPTNFAELLAGQVLDELSPKRLAAHANFKQLMALAKSLKTEYDLAKKTVHGANYGEGWKTFRETVLKGTCGQVVLSAAEAKRLLETYFRLFPEIKERQEQTDETIRAHKPVYNLFGHAATFIGRHTSDMVRTAVSWAPQSTIGQCTNRAAVRLQQYIEDNGCDWNVLFPVHDSLLCEAPADEIYALAKKLAEFMTYTFTSPIDQWQATIGVEVQIGSNWGKYDESDNPLGLKVTQI